MWTSHPFTEQRKIYDEFESERNSIRFFNVLLSI